ncbi:UDP-glucuronosyl/UDP-glucosyltransferase [Vigna unguiculata]|uniref:UDP-glucuronosyl/UDP-glucosyltransferase n=1 Tax=Vigna unguiculata TaxID=3917 RepID=A0A4D6KSH6_VIGUN|nr:UDP-glucuronosyl/UDP-glucosyltransferase [Vigna unguiculata]
MSSTLALLALGVFEPRQYEEVPKFATSHCSPSSLSEHFTRGGGILVFVFSCSGVCGRVARNSGLKFYFERRWRCWISRSLGSTGSWWFVVVTFRPCSGSMGLSVAVGCSFRLVKGFFRAHCSTTGTTMVPSSSKSMATQDNHQSLQHPLQARLTGVGSRPPPSISHLPKGSQNFFRFTPRNIHRLPKVPENLQHLVDLIELPLPRVDKLPENAEATVDVPYHLIPYLKQAFDGLQQPLTKFLERCNPIGASAIYYFLLDHYTSKARVSVHKACQPKSLPTKKLTVLIGGRFSFSIATRLKGPINTCFEEDATHSPTCPRQPRTCLPLHRTRLLLRKCLLLLHDVCHRHFLKNPLRAPATTRVTRASIRVHILLLLENARKREKSKEEARCQRRRGAPVVGVAVVVYGGHRL